MKLTSKRIVCAVLTAVMLMTMALTGVSAATFIVDDGFKFTRESGGTVTIHEYVGTEADVNVPSSLVSQSVTAINEYAFMYNDVIKSMTIPTTVTSLGRGLFYGSSVESVSLPRNCTQIGQYMFYDCDSLKSVTMPTMLKEVPRYCFAQCDSIETITLPSTAKVIGDYAFSDCANLKSVYVSRYTNSISSTAFEDCPQVVIHGYMNTYAHEFAIENSIPFSAIDATAQTLYVTFYDYDGSVFMTVPVTKGSSIKFPAVTPEKPATSTHYYEFSYWDGNVIDIQENEFVYPVYNEIERNDKPEVVNKYSVIFLGGDDVFMDVQMVEEGCDALEPQTVPVKASTPSHYYVFSGWDKPFCNVTENLIVRPVFEEYLREYSVSFKSTDDEVLSEQTVHYGESATAPQAPEIEGYTFVGWDKEFDYITDNLVVIAVYEKNEEPEKPLPVKSTGKLRIEIVGGNMFTIAVNGGNARPQGASYVNTKMPIGAEVTVTVPKIEGVTFIGWMNESGTILSVTDTYTFTTSGNDYLMAVYQTVVEGANSVIFKNAKAAAGNGQIIEIQYYSTEDEIVFPDAPAQAGYDFTGWSHTAEQIQAALAAGEEVVVVANWEVAKVYIDVKVNGGTISTASEANGKYIAYNALTVVAGAAPEGQKFAYWTDASGKVVSYSETYKSYPAQSIELTAVYLAADEVVEKQALVSIAGDPTTDGEKITYTVSWELDASIGNITNYGLVIVDAADYNEDTFYHGSGDSKLFDRAAKATNAVDTKSLTVSGRAYDHTYYAVAFIIYTDATTGESVTVYSDMVEVYKPAP